ncbi:hypothetical protein HZH68_000970 [Vespula germanica]|uniref:Uncharacterized protein n=1 Tax=Vespula germanica TaxID=30212 RepID=A0A834NUS1_VESGE|nr:hypothetical protein HZH68_000970 [Vespula germanica]
MRAKRTEYRTRIYIGALSRCIAMCRAAPQSTSILLRPSILLFDDPSVASSPFEIYPGSLTEARSLSAPRAETAAATSARTAEINNGNAAAAPNSPQLLLLLLLADRW